MQIGVIWVSVMYKIYVGFVGYYTIYRRSRGGFGEWEGQEIFEFTSKKIKLANLILILYQFLNIFDENGNILDLHL